MNRYYIPGIVVTLWLCAGTLVESAPAHQSSTQPSAATAAEEQRLGNEHRRAMRAESRLNYESMYSNLPDALKLPPEVADRLFDLLVEQEFERRAFRPDTAETRTSSTPDYQSLERKQEQELTQLIGTERVAKYHEYEQAWIYRREVKQLEVEIGPGRDALSDDQVETLVSSVRKANEEMQRAAPATFGIFVTARKRQEQSAKLHELRQKRDAQIRAEVAAVLTPPQLAALDARNQRERAWEDAVALSTERVQQLGSRHQSFADPAYQEAMRPQWRLTIEAKYADLARSLKLSSGLAARLYDLLVAQMNESLAGPVQTIINEQGVSTPTPAYQAMQRKQDRELAALIGERGLDQLHEYDEAFDFRQQAKRVQLDLAGGPHALRDDQLETLVSLMRDAHEKWPEVTPAGPALVSMAPEERKRQEAKGRELARQRDARMLESAAAILTPPQLAALDALFRRRQAQEASSELMGQRVEYAIQNGLPRPPAGY